MGKKNTTQSALKKSSNIYLKNNKSKFAGEGLFNNLRKSRNDNSSKVDQVTQCVFLGALCLKPVPDIFQVTLQPITSTQKSNTSILCNNNHTREINSTRKVKNKTEVSSTIHKNFCVENVSDKKFENKILKLIGRVKQSIQEEIIDKTRVDAEIHNQSDLKSKKFSEYCIEEDGNLRKKKFDFHQNLRDNLTKTQGSKNKLSGKRKLLKKHSRKTSFLDNKSFSDWKINMSSEMMKNYANFADRSPFIMKGNDKLKANVENNSLEKDISVENVIRRLRQKKSIEVKKVHDVDSKLKRITPMPQTKHKSEEFDESKHVIINQDLHQTVTVSEIVVECDKTSSKPTDFLELEDDDIEDYLEIDQNVVEDLEALIPEEEIVSISNSLIQPENDLTIESEDDTLISEKKPENTEILLESSTEPVSKCDSNNCKDQIPNSKSQEIESQMKDEEIENNIRKQPIETLVLDAPTHDIENSTRITDSHETITINNNGSLSRSTDDIVPQIPINVEPVETFKRKLGVRIADSKKRKVSPKMSKTLTKKKESRKSNKSKQDLNASKNLRKITDFFTPNPIKTESSEEQKPQINEIQPEEISQNTKNKTVERDSLEIIESEKNELPCKIRTLRSRSILPVKTLDEPKTKELQLTHAINTLKKNIENSIVEQSEVPNDKLSEKTCSSKEFSDKNSIANTTKLPEEPSFQIADDIQSKTEISNGDSSISALVVNTESENKLNIPKKTVKDSISRKRQPKGGNKRSKTTPKVADKTKEMNNSVEKVVEIVNVDKDEKSILSETAHKEVVCTTEANSKSENKYKERDSNENHVLPATSTEKEQISAVETSERSSEIVQSDKEQITEIETSENVQPIKTTEPQPKKKINKTVSTTLKNLAQKKKKGIVRRKKNIDKIMDKPNETKNSGERTRNEKILSSHDKVKVKQSKKGRGKPQKRNKNLVLEKQSDGLDDDQAKLEQKNQETKLEIYDFDDKSNEAVELLGKSTKKRKYQIVDGNQKETDVSSEKPSKLPREEMRKDQNFQGSSKKQIEPENVNNNKPNITAGSIESFLRSSVAKSSSNTPTEDEAVPKNEVPIMDLNDKTSSEAVPKTSPETEKEIDQFGQDWKPSYGPYKRIDRCNVCLLSFKSYKKLRAHKKIHEVENPYKCWECDDCFEDVEKLAAHLRIHKGKMPYPCKKCDATFWTTFQLERHQLVHVLKKVPPPAKPPSKVFKCEECGKEFKKICDLERHTRVHTGEKPSVCNICNKRFQQSYNLNKHLYTHTQEKNFECVICQKKFGRNDVLNRHVLTHSIVKPFKCSICSRTFIRNSQLKLHLRKHHGLDEDPGKDTSVDDPTAGTSAKV